MAPKLELCMTVRGYVAIGSDILTIKDVLNGPQRLFIPVTGGFIKGASPGPAEGLEAEVLPGSSDGLLLNPATNVAHLNVRIGARSSSGEAIYIEYRGILKMDDAGQKVFSAAPGAKSTQYGDQEWWMSPTVETSDAKFKWMEDTLWLGEGRYVVDEKGRAVEYQVYRVGN